MRNSNTTFGHASHRSTRAAASSVQMVILACGIMGGTAFAQNGTPSNQIVLRGVARDFQAAHPDFDITDPLAMGHVARSMSQSLASNGLPLYVGSGLSVNTQWYDKDANPIMPYGDAGLFGGHFDVDVYSSATTSELYHEHQYDDKFDLTYIDVANDVRLLFDSVVGDAYANPIRIEFVNTHNGGGGTYTFDGGSGIETGVTANGFVRVVQASDLAELTVYFEALNSMRGTEPSVSQNDVVDRDDAFAVRIYDTTTDELIYEIAAYEHIEGDKDGDGDHDDADHHDYDDNDGDGGHNEADHHGDDDDDDEKDHDKDGVHSDSDHHDNKDVDGDGDHDDADHHTKDKPSKNTVNDSCGVQISDTLGTFGSSAPGGISSTASFGQWYNNVPGMNIAQPYSITLNRDANGVYEFFSTSFFPMDGAGYGEEGNTHNSNFTYSITASFIYRACQNQFVEFQGSDDAWLFINGELVMDLGGVATPAQQYVALDRLGLTDGESFVVSFFSANRRTTSSSLFRLRTNIEMVAKEYALSSSPFFD